jgi:Protein of unknown function (DUF3892)
MMATAPEHGRLYAALRAKVLARHFALGRWFRANMVSLENALAALPDEVTRGRSAEEVELLRRWNVADHFRENPLMEGGKLFTALAVEVSLGNEASVLPLVRGIETVSSLFPIRRGRGGWLVRWDPVTSDNWAVGPDGPTVCQEFLVTDEGAYQFCSPGVDPRRVPWRSLDTLRTLLPRPEADAYELAEDSEHFLGYHPDFFWRYQRWECSMDEISSLVAGLAIADRLAGRGRSGAVRRAVVTPARLLGEYLADNGYLLVRPCGGFNARGGTGALPAMELPLSRALQSVAGGNLGSRLGFHDALERAGYARDLDARIAELVAVAVAGTLVVGPLVAGLGSLAPLVGAPVGALAGTAVATAARLIGPVQIGTAAALFRHRDCFDLSNDASAEEVALAYLLKEFEPTLRFQAWMAGMRVGGGYARGFPPHLALSALDDPDPTVREAYLGLFRSRRAGGDPVDLEPGMLDSAQATAVAVLLGAVEFEELLVKQLDVRYDRFAGTQDEPIEGDRQNVRLVIDYLAGVALAWLHARRRADAGAPVATPGFPTPPASFSGWPAPVVPRLVLENLPEVRRVVLGDRPLPAGDVDLFSPRLPTRKPEAPPAPVPPHGPLVGEFTYVVAESARDVFTGITLEWGDEYEIEATGEIRSGAFLAGGNGPAGWTDRLVDDARWPLHSGLDPSGAHPYALLARIGGWFLVGERMDRRRFLSSLTLPLHLRINDDNPGNGSGRFVVTVRLWGSPRRVVYPERAIRAVTRNRGRVEKVGGVHADGSAWWLTVAEAVEWVDRYGHSFTVGADDGPRVQVRRGPGQVHLRSVGDRSRTNNLESLPASL